MMKRLVTGVAGKSCTRVVFFALSLCGTLLANQLWAAGPAINLQSTQLIEDIRVTRNAATDVEDNLQAAIGRLAEYTAQLKKAGCADHASTPACRELKDDLRENYMAMLTGVKERLPELRTALSRVVGRLETRLGATAEQSLAKLQENLTASSSVARGRQKLKGISGSKLSQSLGSLHELVAGAAANNTSLETIQADLYLDMKESIAMIDLIEADIFKTTILAQVQLGDVEVSEADLKVAREVQGLLFGTEYNEVAYIEAVVPQPAAEDYVSPLEL